MNKSYGPLALREVQTWRYMRHPNIVQLYEVLASESYIYLVYFLSFLFSSFSSLNFIQIKTQKVNKIKLK